MRLRGSYFEVVDKFTPRRGGSALRSQPNTEALIISVPKRLIRSATRRNAVKRVVRESWRLAMPLAERQGQPPMSLLVRLTRSPNLAAAVGPKVKIASPDPATKAVALPMTLTAFKRTLRADIDNLWPHHALTAARCDNAAGARKLPETALSIQAGGSVVCASRRPHERR